MWFSYTDILNAVDILHRNVVNVFRISFYEDDLHNFYETALAACLFRS